MAVKMALMLVEQVAVSSGDSMVGKRVGPTDD